MPVSELRLVKRYAEFCSLDQIKMIPSGTRGLYVLLKKNDRLSRQSPKDKFDVVYIGMARGLKGGIKFRLRSHRRKKADAWTHFSVYEVWDTLPKAKSKNWKASDIFIGAILGRTNLTSRDHSEK